MYALIGINIIVINLDLWVFFSYELASTNIQTKRVFNMIPVPIYRKVQSKDALHHKGRVLFQNVLCANPQISVAMPIPSSEIMF